METVSLNGRTAIGGKFVYTGKEGKLSVADQSALLAIARSLQGKTHFVEIKVYPNPAEHGTDPKLNHLSLAFARAQQTASLLVDQGKIRRDLVRIVIAADKELSDDDRSSRERVDVNTVQVYTYDSQEKE